MPFCLEKCSFCQFFKYFLESRKDTDRWVDWMIQSFDYYAPVFKDVSFSQLVVGGGTPGLLAADQMERVFSALFERFTFNDDRPRAFEFNPRSVTEKRLKALVPFGFDRVSMGVQTTDAGILDTHNRYYQNMDMLTRAVRLVREAGIRELNLDLILGMSGDTSDKFMKSFEAVAALEPDMITVYHLVPQPEYVRTIYDGQIRKQQLDHQTQVDGVVEWVRNNIGRLGYVSDTEELNAGQEAWTFRLSGEDAHPTHAQESMYDDTSPAAFSLFGLGPMARSQIHGEIWYLDNGDIDPQLNVSDARFEVAPIDTEYEMLKTVFMAMRIRARLNRRMFKRAFGIDVFERYGGALDRLSAKGLITVDDEGISFPQTRRKKFLCALEFIGPDALSRVAGARAERERFLRVDVQGASFDLQVESLRANARYLTTHKGWGLRWLNVSSDDQARSPKKVRVFSQIARKTFAPTVDATSNPTVSRVTERLVALINRMGSGVRAELATVQTKPKNVGLIPIQ